MRPLAAVLAIGLLSACGALPPEVTATVQHPPPELSECRAESYDFVGRGSLNSLGILHPDRAEATTSNGVPGTFWVPHGVTQLYERDDRGTEDVRIFCAVLDDGGTLINLPVAPDWRPPS